MAEVGSIVMVAVIGFVVLAIGGGLGYWFWIASRPKKMTWKAMIYQVGDGVIPIIKRKGKNVVDYKLSDLKPYTKDIIEKVEKKNAATYYWLQKLKKPTPAVTADCVEVWDQKDKVVRVLLEEDTCTILKPGYDRKIGSVLFRPMPHDRINMIKTEMAERKDRIENSKDILAQITPFVVVGISILGLVIIAYFASQAAIKVADTFVIMQEKSIAAQNALATMYLNAVQGNVSAVQNRNIEKEEPPMIPP